MKKENYSKKILQLFIESLNPGMVPAAVLAEILHISPDAAYRRLSGKVDLTLNEAVMVCQRCNLSLDRMTSLNNGEIVLHYIPMYSESTPASFLDDMKMFELFMSDIIREKGECFTAYSDLPVTFQFRYPSIMAFTIYCNHNETTNFAQVAPFSLASTSISLHHNLFEKIADMYDEIDSFEIWGNQTFARLIEMLVYYKSICLLNPDEENTLLNDVRCLIEDCERFAIESCKNGKGNFRLHISHYPITNNLYLFRLKERFVSYFKMFAVNCMWTDDEYYCQQQKRWFDGMMNSSAIISGSNLKERKLFFDKLNLLIDKV